MAKNIVDTEPEEGQEFYAQDGIVVVYDSELKWYRFKYNPKGFCHLYQGDPMPQDWRIVGKKAKEKMELKVKTIPENYCYEMLCTGITYPVQYVIEP